MKNALAVLDKLVNTPLEEFDANAAALVKVQAREGIVELEPLRLGDDKETHAFLRTKVNEFLEVAKARNARLDKGLSCSEVRLVHAPDRTYLEAAISPLPSEARDRRMVRHTLSELGIAIEITTRW